MRAKNREELATINPNLRAAILPKISFSSKFAEIMVVEKRPE